MSTEAQPRGMIRRHLRVLLLEDSAADAELMEREMVRRGLRVTAQRVDTAGTYEDVLRTFNPHVILCDHGVPGLDTIGAMRVAKSVRPAVPVIVVSGSMNVRSIVAVMRAGAEDVVLKSDLVALAPAIEAAITARAALSRLSPRQLEVFRLVAEGYTTPAIAERLSLSAKTIETHRGEIMKRLGIHDLARLVRYAVRLGMVSVDA